MASRKGIPNRATLRKEAILTEILDRIVDWEKFYTKLYKQAMRGNVKAAKIIEERRWGKPAQSVTLSGGTQPLLIKLDTCQPK